MEAERQQKRIKSNIQIAFSIHSTHSFLMNIKKII